MATMVITNRAGGAETVEKPLAPGRAAADDARPVALSTEDLQVFERVADAVEGTLTVGDNGSFVVRANLYVNGALATEANSAPVNIKMLTSRGFEAITNLAASTALTVPALATIAIIQCEGQNVRWRDDGVAPTASTGMLLPAGSELPYDASGIAALRFIQVSASAKLMVSYYS